MVLNKSCKIFFHTHVNNKSIYQNLSTIVFVQKGSRKTLALKKRDITLFLKNY
jgi:hypothetical protein